MEFSSLNLSLPSKISMEMLASKLQEKSKDALCVIDGGQLTMVKLLNLTSKKLTLETKRKNDFGLMEYYYREKSSDTTYCTFTPLVLTSPSTLPTLEGKLEGKAKLEGKEKEEKEGKADIILAGEEKRQIRERVIKI